MSLLAPSPAAATEPTPRRAVTRRRTTPGLLKVFTAAAILAAIVFATVAAIAGAQVRSGFDAIGHTEAPQVVATNDLAYSLNDMDANLANILMVGDNRLGPGIDAASFTKLFNQDRSAADHDLQQAAVHAGTDGAASEQVRAALDALGEYEGLAAQVMYLDGASPHRAPGKVPAAESALFAKATDLMQNTVLPAAKNVADSNGAALETSYEHRHGQAEAAIWWIVLAGLATIGVLAGFQALLLRRTRRIVNPALAAATLLTLIVTVWAAGTMSSAAEDLHGAKKDAFDSVSALTAAKAVSTDANADESRIIVDPDRAAKYQASYLAKTQKLMDLGPDVTLSTYDEQVARDLAAYDASPDRGHVIFGGYFGTELKNITFPGEQQAARQLLAAYQTYELDDRKLRQKISTDLSEAIRYDTSPAPEDSDGAFNAYTAALQAVTDINTKAFADSVSSGLHQTDPWPWIPLGAAAAVVALAIAGVRPRLAEYR